METKGWMTLINHDGRIQLCYSIKEHDNEASSRYDSAGSMGATDWICSVVINSFI
jgi:hypothetical protein